METLIGATDSLRSFSTMETPVLAVDSLRSFSLMETFVGAVDSFGSLSLKATLVGVADSFGSFSLMEKRKGNSVRKWVWHDMKFYSKQKGEILHFIKHKRICLTASAESTESIFADVAYSRDGEEPYPGGPQVYMCLGSRLRSPCKDLPSWFQTFHISIRM